MANYSFRQKGDLVFTNGRDANGPGRFLPQTEISQTINTAAAHAVNAETGKINALTPTVKRISDLEERLAERVAGDRAIIRKTSWATAFCLGHMAVWGVLEEQLLCRYHLGLTSANYSLRENANRWTWVLQMLAMPTVLTDFFPRSKSAKP